MKASEDERKAMMMIVITIFVQMRCEMRMRQEKTAETDANHRKKLERGLPLYGLRNRNSTTFHAQHLVLTT